MTLSRRDLILSAGGALLASAATPSEPRGAALASPDSTSRPRELPPDVEEFLRAVRAGDVGEVRRLLASSPALAACRAADGRSAFVIAHLAGRPEVATILRQSGLELDIVEAVLAEDWPRFEELSAADPELCNAPHPIGGTPLHAAALHGCVSNWRLRYAGCEPDAQPPGGNGFTAARTGMDAPRISDARIAVTDLLANGGDPNAPQRGGDSILHGAVRRRSATLVRLAIRKGADAAARDATGRTARDLALELDWPAGAALLAAWRDLPRDHRASRFLLDAERRPIERPDLSDVPQAKQSAVTGNSHGRLAKVRELVAADRRLVFSISTDDELAIEASAHMGNRPLIRFHLDHGAPLALPTAVALGDHDSIRFWLRRDPRLVDERGAHDFPVMFYGVFGGDVDTMELLHELGVPVDQHSRGGTALHWCVMRDDRDITRWLLERGADPEALSFIWQRQGQTPLELAQARGRPEIAALLKDAGARR